MSFSTAQIKDATKPCNHFARNKFASNKSVPRPSYKLLSISREGQVHGFQAEFRQRNSRDRGISRAKVLRPTKTQTDPIRFQVRDVLARTVIKFLRAAWKSNVLLLFIRYRLPITKGGSPSRNLPPSPLLLSSTNPHPFPRFSSFSRAKTLRFASQRPDPFPPRHRTRLLSLYKLEVRFSADSCSRLQRALSLFEARALLCRGFSRFIRERPPPSPSSARVRRAFCLCVSLLCRN